MSAPGNALRELRARVRLRTRIRVRLQRRRTSPPITAPDSYQRWVDTFDTLSPDDLDGMRCVDRALHRRTRFSLLLTVSDESRASVAAVVGSVLEQVYDDWELVCLLGKDSAVDELQLLDVDPRIVVVRNESRTTRASAFERALAHAKGEFCVLLDTATRLRPHALLLLALVIEETPDAVLAYSDEDLIASEGRRSGHWFKPDWNPALLRVQNYIGRVAAFSLARARDALRERPLPDADVAWGVFLRITDGVDRASVVHVPHVLAHRQVDDREPREKCAAEVVEAFLEAAGMEGTVEAIGTVGMRVVYALPRPAPRVRVLVATALAHEFVEPCLASLLEDTDYEDFRLTVVVDGDTLSNPRNREVLARLATADGRMETLVYPSRPFNYSWVHNFAVAKVNEDVVAFVNDDVSVVTPRWLELMVGHLLQPRVGAVGARLLYPDGTVQHGGVLLGAGGVAGHFHHGLPAPSEGYHGRALLDQDLSCVTGACMLLRREAYEDVGGMDEDFGIAYNDVDLCIRLARAGWRIVFSAGAELTHRESTSLGPPDSVARRDRHASERQLMQSRWGEVLMNDPSYSPNLDLGSPGKLAFPPRVEYRWR